MIEMIILQDGVEVARDEGKCVLSVMVKDSDVDEHMVLNTYGHTSAYKSTLAACTLAGYIADKVAAPI